MIQIAYSYNIKDLRIRWCMDCHIQINNRQKQKSKRSGLSDYIRNDYVTLTALHVTQLYLQRKPTCCSENRRVLKAHSGSAPSTQDAGLRGVLVVYVPAVVKSYWH